MPCVLAGPILWGMLRSDPLTVGLWIVSGVVAALLVNRLWAQAESGWTRLCLPLLVVLVLATLIPLLPMMSDMGVYFDDAGLVAMGLLWAPVPSIPLALLAWLLAERWHAALREDTSATDHRRFGLAAAASVFVPVFAFSAFLGVGMALTG